MRTRSPSEISAARIPKITDLRNQLNYGDARLARCAAFTDDLRVFRRRYSASGVRGSDLWDWKSSKHQDALRRMTTSFLDENGYGEVYWPSDPAAPNFNSLQYSEDSIFITQTMRQLIFRLNLQQYRNIKYKKKEHQPDPLASEIIDLEDDGSPIDLSRPNLPTRNAVPPYNFPTAIPSAEGNMYPPNTHSPTNFASPELPPSQYDEYDTPASPDYEPERSTTKRKLQPPEKPQPAKRSKMIALKVPSDRSSLANPRQTAHTIKQASSRARKTVQRTDYADRNGFDQTIVSQEVTDEPLGHNIGFDHRKNMRQNYKNVERVVTHTRTVQPSITNEPPPPSFGPINPTLDSHIDPNLERFVSSSSTTHQPRPGRTSSTIYSNDRVQADVQPFLSPAPTISTLASAHETTQQSSLTPKPVPQDVQSNQGEKSSTTPANPVPVAPTVPKSNIDFNYIVILSRAPIYSYKSWNPKGHFMEKSLSELLHELPFESKEDIEGLIIRLEGPGVDVEETLGCGEEAKFDTTKTRFLRMVKMCLKNHNKTSAGKTLVLNFEIEAVREGGVEEDDDDDDDLVF